MHLSDFSSFLKTGSKLLLWSYDRLKACSCILTSKLVISKQSSFGSKYGMIQFIQQLRQISSCPRICKETWSPLSEGVDIVMVLGIAGTNQLGQWTRNGSQKLLRSIPFLTCMDNLFWQCNEQCTAMHKSKRRELFQHTVDLWIIFSIAQLDLTIKMSRVFRFRFNSESRKLAWFRLLTQSSGITLSTWRR